MFFVEKISKNIVSSIYDISELDNDEKEVIEYGVLLSILKIIGILMITLFGILFGVFVQALVFYFTTCTLRKYSGGIHSESPSRCAVISTFVSVFIPLCINKIYKLVPFSVIIFSVTISLICCYFIILKLAPVDSLAKPIVNIKMREQLKIKSLITITALSILLISLIVVYDNSRYIMLLKLSYSICTALMWQCFTLTSIGHIIMRKVDNILKYII